MNTQNLLIQFMETEPGEEIRRCIQCGTCSGSCPMADAMDYGPRSLFAMIRDGEMEAVFHANTPWMCVSCYQCIERCPQEIPVAELMYGLKRIITQAREEAKPNRAKDLHRAFSFSLEECGRVTEPVIMAVYSLKHPFAGISTIPLALKMAWKKRVELKIQKVKAPSRFRRKFKHLRS